MFPTIVTCMEGNIVSKWSFEFMKVAWSLKVKNSFCIPPIRGMYIVFMECWGFFGPILEGEIDSQATCICCQLQYEIMEQISPPPPQQQQQFIYEKI